MSAMLGWGLTVGLLVWIGAVLKEAGVTKLWSWAQQSDPFGRKRRAVDEEQFIEDTVRRMEDDPRAVEAIYAQSQYHATNPSLVVALIAFIVSIVSAMTWADDVLQKVLTIFALVVVWAIGFRAVFVTLFRSQLYGRAIDRYCERIGLPKRPR